MKQVTISGPYIEGQWLLIDSPAVLMEYIELTSGKVVEQMKRLIRSKASVERWDHMITPTDEGNILAATIMYCKTNNKNPVIEMDGIIQQKFLTMLDNLSKGRTLLVNPLGGYCFMADNYQILNSVEYDAGFKPTHVIQRNTRYINLENDPQLEERTKSYLGELDKNYSYILNLHKYDKKALFDVFDEFKHNGGEIVHVYTTGTNVPQMYDYFEAALKAGLSDFVFEFNEGISADINTFIEHAKSKATVSVL